MKKINKNKLFLILFLTFIVFMIILNQFTSVKDINVEDVRVFIENQGRFSGVVYVLLLTFLPLLLFPDSIIVIAGGLAFGLFGGVILTSVGSLIGSMISFYISRYLGRDFVKNYTKDIQMFKSSKTKSNGFLLILLLRLIPLFPFKVVSYSAGLTNVKAFDFAVATVVGSLPGIILYTNIGDKITQDDPRSLYLSVALLGVLIIISLVAKKYLKKRDAQRYREDSEIIEKDE